MTTRSKAPDNPAAEMGQTNYMAPEVRDAGFIRLGDNPKPKRRVDPELAALAKVDRILAGLSEAGRWRVCQWLSSKHNLFPEAPREDR